MQAFGATSVTRGLADMSLTTLQAIRPFVKPTMTDDELYARYEEFGGCGRWALDLNIEDAREKVNTAVEAMSMAQIRAAVSSASLSSVVGFS